ncbi:MAG: hypothetical protein AAF081_09805 [Actinomycetota bacterium]
MQWFLHNVRAAWGRQPAVFASAGLTSIVVVIGAFVFLGGDPDVEITADPATPDFTETVLEELGSGSDSFVADLIDDVLPGLSAEDQAMVVDSLIETFGGEDGDLDAVADGIVRRLGLDATEVGDIDELIALAIAEIDPSGSIDSADELMAAFDAWANSTSIHVVEIVPAAEAAGPLADLSSMSFETAAAEVAAMTSTSGVTQIGLGGIQGLDPLTIPAVELTVDQAARTIVLQGETTSLGGRTEVAAIARWGGRSTPSILATIRTSGRTLADLGFPGSVGEVAIPDATFVLAETGQVVTAGDLGDAWDLISRDAGPTDELVVEAGVNLLTRIDTTAVPAIVRDTFGVSGAGPVGLRAALGTGFGVVSGAGGPTDAVAVLTLPGIAPPALPSWLTASDEEPWAVTMTVAGNDVELGLAGVLEAELDGAIRTFASRLSVESAGGAARGRLVGELREPWAAPFGVDWLDFEMLTMSADLDADDVRLGFATDVGLAGRSAALSFELAAGGDTTEVQMTAAIDEVSSRDVVTLLADAAAIAAPSALPEIVLRDVLVDIRAGAQPTVAVGAAAEVAGEPADVLFSVESPAGEPGVIVGVGLDELALGRAFPALGDSLVGDLAFPATTLVLSDLDGRFERSQLSGPAQRFFDGRADDLVLAPGLSVLSQLDLSETPVGDPLDALGYDGGVFPLIGTLPSSLLGGSGGSGDGGLADLALAVELPEIAPADAPDWFEGGRLSLVVSGQPSVGLEGEMTVRIDGESLTFVVGAELAKTPLGVELALFGALETERSWERPFGVSWLVVNDLAIELSVAPSGVVGLGFAGDVRIGTKDIDAALAVDLSPAGVPINLIVSGASAEGISTNDLLLVQQEMARAAGTPVTIDTSDYPGLDLRDIELRFAPQPSERLGIPAGFVVAGDVYAAIGGAAPTRFAFMDFRLTDDGLDAEGRLSAWELGPLEWSDIVLDLELSRDAQYFVLDGRVSALGLAVDADIDLSFDSVVFKGQQALADLRLLVEVIERVIDDPFGAIQDIPEVLDATGVPQPEWLDTVLEQVADLVEDGQAITSEAVDSILNGGTVSLVTFPSTPEPTRCPTIGPFEEDGLCYTTPSATSDGLPSGGRAKDCYAPYREHKGRCYTTKPRTIEVCVPLPFGRERCASESIPGIPKDGRAKACPATAPISAAGRCWTIPPGDILPPLPEGGLDRVCPATTPVLEDDGCWIIPPSVAAVGLPTPGVCPDIPGLSCKAEDLFAGNFLDDVFEGLIDRLSDW